MPIQISCPSCSRQLRVPDNLIGQRVKCPGCQNTFTAEVESGPPPRDEPAPPREERRPARDEGYQEDEPAPRRRDEEEYEEERPSRRRRRSENADEYEDDRPSRRRSRRDFAPHRGTTILVFAILGWAFCFIFGIAAWVMGNNDLKEIRAGRMDPEGESLTNIGRILGMIQCILVCVVLAFYCVFIIVGAATGGFK